jgi:hypothetical protein
VRSADDFRTDRTSTNAIAGRRARNLPAEGQNSVLLKKVDIFNLNKDIPPDPVAGKQNPASDKQNPLSEKQNPAAGRGGRGGEAAGGGFAGVDDGRKSAGQRDSRTGDRGCFPSGEKGEGGFRKNTNATSFHGRRE